MRALAMAARGSDARYSTEGDRDASARLGTTLGRRWTLDELLGSGGSSVVYAAHHRNGRRAAVKVLHRTHAARPPLRRRFLAEGYAANRVGHAGAVSVLDDGEEPDGTVFLVMEQLSGASLAKQLGQGTLSERGVIVAAIGILDVLAAAHDRGIVHRDVKPSNVFLTDDGVIKVLDFGSARIREQDAFTTQSDAVLGTPAFMAPELATGRTDEVDARTDIWAVGATMFQLLTGETVHAARTNNEALVAAATQRARSLSIVRPQTTPELAAIVDRALSFAPSDRWPNARAMRMSLSSIVKDTISVVDGGLATVPEQGFQKPGSNRPNRLRPAALVVGVLLVLSLLVARMPKRVNMPPVAQARALAHRDLIPAQTADSPPLVSSSAPIFSLEEAAPPPRNRQRSRAASAASNEKPKSQPAPHPDAPWQVDDVLDRRK